MHNDLAWSVIGVDPAVHKNLEHLASRQGVSIGRLLELMIHFFSVKESDEAKRRKALRGLVAEMADCLMEATDLLEFDDGGMTSATEQAPPTPRDAPAAVPVNASEMGAPSAQVTKSSSKPAEFRRGFLRRSA